MFCDSLRPVAIRVLQEFDARCEVPAAVRVADAGQRRGGRRQVAQPSLNALPVPTTFFVCVYPGAGAE
jgi:hypothetical protein